PRGTLLGGSLLEERLTVGAVYVALQDDWPPGDAPERAFGHRHVVPRQVELRVAGLGKERLVGVGDDDLATGDLDHAVPRLRHGDIVYHLEIRQALPGGGTCWPVYRGAQALPPSGEITTWQRCTSSAATRCFRN